MVKPRYKKKKRIKTYTNRKPLECCEFASLDRCLGVEVGPEFTHQGLQVQMAECTYETITVNTATYGGPKPVEDIEEEKAKMSAKIIADINRVIDELRSHKARILEDTKTTHRGKNL